MGSRGASECLRDAVEHDLVVHRRLDVALGAEVLGAVICDLIKDASKLQ